MKLNFDDEKPVFLQIAEGMEDAILTGVFQERESDSFYNRAICDL